MSRIGKKAVPVPAGVTASVNGQMVSVKGPKGELKVVLNDQVLAKMEQGGIKVDPKDKSKLARSSWGMSRTLVANLITGVTVGYSKSLEITGVGYRAALNGKALQLNLGYSHDVTYDVPAGIEIKVPKPTEIVISGIDKQRVGQVAAEIREYPWPRALQGQGRQIRRRIHLPQGRQEEVIGGINGYKNHSTRTAHNARPQGAGKARQFASAAFGVPLEQEHLCTGHR